MASSENTSAFRGGGGSEALEWINIAELANVKILPSLIIQNSGMIENASVGMLTIGTLIPMQRWSQ